MTVKNLRIPNPGNYCECSCCISEGMECYQSKLEDNPCICCLSGNTKDYLLYMIEKHKYYVRVIEMILSKVDHINDLTVSQY